MNNFKALNREEMHMVKGGATTIMGSGTDEGGFFVILDTGTQCVKVYSSGPGQGVFDD